MKKLVLNDPLAQITEQQEANVPEMQMGAAAGIAELKKPNKKSISLPLEGNTGFSCMTMLSASRKLRTDTVKAVGKSPISTISVGTRE